MAKVFGNLKKVVNLISLDVVCYFVEHLLNISNWDKCEKHNKIRTPWLWTPWLCCVVPPERRILCLVASDIRLNLLGLQRGGSGTQTRAVQQLSASDWRGLHVSVEQHSHCMHGSRPWIREHGPGSRPLCKHIPRARTLLNSLLNMQLLTKLTTQVLGCLAVRIARIWITSQMIRH